MKANKRGQITMFMILGIVILVVVGVFIYLNSLTASKRIEEDTRGVQQADIQPIKKFVKSCIERVGERALSFLGVQGGIYLSSHVYDSQPQGLLHYNHIEEGKSHYFVYATQKPFTNQGTDFMDNDYGRFYSSSPRYPNESFPKESFKGYFYVNQYKKGERYPFEQLKDDLEVAINSSLFSCLDFSFFKGYLFEDTKYVPEDINVLLTEDEVVVSFHYSLKITSKTTTATTVLDDTFVTIPVRLKKIYTFTSWLFEQDTTDITFDLRGQTQDGMTSSIYRENFYQQDDLILIDDPKSSLAGKPYLFYVMRHNRKPAAQYVVNKIKSFDVGTPLYLTTLFPHYGVDLDPDEDDVSHVIKYRLAGSSNVWVVFVDGDDSLSATDYTFRHIIYDNPSSPTESTNSVGDDYEEILVKINEPTP